MRVDRHEESSQYMTMVGNHELTCTFEVGDWLSFVSSGRATHDASYETIVPTENGRSFDSTTDIELATGHLTVADSEQVTDDRIERHLSAKGSSRLGDIVARFVIEDATDLKAEIDGRVFDHCGRNRYLQYRTDTVSLIGDQRTIRIRAVDTNFPEELELVCYARDQPDGSWAVHVRGLAYDLDAGFLRLYWGPWRHSEWVDRIAGLPPLARRFLYVRERLSASKLWHFVPFSFPAQYVSAVGLSNIDSVSLSVTLEIIDD